MNQNPFQNIVKSIAVNKQVKQIEQSVSNKNLKAFDSLGKSFTVKKASYRTVKTPYVRKSN